MFFAPGGGTSASAHPRQTVNARIALPSRPIAGTDACGVGWLYLIYNFRTRGTCPAPRRFKPEKSCIVNVGCGNPRGLSRAPPFDPRLRLSDLAVSSELFRAHTDASTDNPLPASTNRPRVLLVDDHEPALRKFAHMLEAEFQVAGRVFGGLEGVRAALELGPDVVTLDMSMPDLDGLEVARRIRRSGSTARIVFLTIHSDSDYVAAALKVGALGYVLKPRAAQDLVAAIRSALIGELFISPGVELNT